MKVKQKKAKFIPMVITIESEEEADALWYVLVCDDGETRVECLKRRNIKGKEMDNILSALDGMFDDYSDVYDLDDC